MCPVTVLELEDSVFAQVMSLNDSYNSILSSATDDLESFADAYMIIKGMTADEEDINNMKEHRVLMLDSDSDASYLTKSVTDQQTMDLLSQIKDSIHKVSQCPDFQDPLFTADSGVALKFKLIGFMNAASVIENLLVKALQRRVELICSIISLTSSDTVWRDMDIVVNHNLPNTLEPSTPTELMQLKNLVSDKTLLGLLPFVKDVEEEIKEVEAQNERNMSLYAANSFNVGDEDEDELLEDKES